MPIMEPESMQEHEHVLTGAQIDARLSYFVEGMHVERALSITEQYNRPLAKALRAAIETAPGMDEVLAYIRIVTAYVGAVTCWKENGANLPDDVAVSAIAGLIFVPPLNEAKQYFEDLRSAMENARRDARPIVRENRTTDDGLFLL